MAALMNQRLQALREQFASLVDDNASLELDKQVEPQALSLDQIEREIFFQGASQQVQQDGDKMQTRLQIQCHAMQRVLHACWYNMQVQAKCIKALQGKGCTALCVNNFPLASTPPSKNLQDEVSRHELMLSVTRLITFKPWQSMTDSELEQRLNASPLDRRSFKTIAEGVQRLLGELWQAQARSPEQPTGGEAAAQDARERAVHSGSTSYTFLTSDTCSALSLVLPCQQVELNLSAHEASKHSLLLTYVITHLKQLFNTQFEQLWHAKHSELIKIRQYYQRLREIDIELNEKGMANFILPAWDCHENPSLIMEQRNGTVETVSSEYSIESSSSLCLRALQVMMDDHVEVQLQERLLRQVTPPPCLSKPANKLNEGERNAVETYERRVATLCSEREAYRSQLLQERAQLRASLKEGCERFDAQLYRLSIQRVHIEASVQHEQLKVARIKLWSLNRSHALHTEKYLRQDVMASERKVAQLLTQRQQLQIRCEVKRKQHEAMLIHDRQQARGFRREFTQLSPMVVDQLAKIYKRRPAMQLSAAQLRFLSRKLGGSSVSEEVPKATPGVAEVEPCRMYMAALRVMDATSNASPSVDTTAWSALCRLRRAKVETEIKVKASALEVTEADAALSTMQLRLDAERRRQLELTSQLELNIQHTRHLLLNTQIQVLLGRGHIEMHCMESLADTEHALLVSLQVVRALNSHIRECGTRKLNALHECLRFRTGLLRHAEWHASEVQALSQILSHDSKHLDKLTITAEIRQFLEQENDSKTSCEKLYYEHETLSRRLAELEDEVSTLQREKLALLKDNQVVTQQLVVLQTRNHEERLSHSPKRTNNIRLVVERSRLQRAIRADGEQLRKLREDLDKMKLRTFPTLFDVSF